MDVVNVGITFVKEYFGQLSENPTQLAAMYNRESQMVTEAGVKVEGVDAIKNHLASKALEQRKFRITHIGSFPSVADSIFVVVRGTILTRTSAVNFRQSFVLGASKGGKDACYYVHNDVLEILDEAAAVPEVAAPVAEPVPEPVAEPEPEPVAEPEPEPVAEPEPEPEPVVEEKKVEEPAPVVEEKPAPEPVKRTGWAAIAASKATDAPAPVTRQVVRGGAVPGAVGVQKKVVEEEAKKRDEKPRGPRPEKTPAFSIFVSGIPKNLDQAAIEGEIEKVFTGYGTIKSKTVKVTHGYCFVDFTEKEAMEKAIAAAGAGSVVIGGEKLKCQKKDEKPAKADKPARK